MKSFGFIWKGIRHYRSAYLGVLAGAAVGAMVLLGALMAGDSVQESLTKSAELRTGKVATIFSGGERFFKDDLEARNGGAALLYLRGQVNVVGVDEGFWDFAPEEAEVFLKDDEAAISGALARALELEVGDAAAEPFSPLLNPAAPNIRSCQPKRRGATAPLRAAVIVAEFLAQCPKNLGAEGSKRSSKKTPTITIAHSLSKGPRRW